MKLTKTLIAMTVTLAVLVGHADSGDSSPFLLDTADGTRIAVEGEAIPIAYSPHWNGAASCTVTESGKDALVASATDEGTISWTPQGIGGHTLTHTAGGDTLTAQFAVLGDDVVVHAGTLGTSETWGTNKTHLVTVAMTVPSGVSLTIERGAVVKFMPGTSLTVASGGSCTARGVVFTHVNDDTIGGDTLCDGDGGQGAAHPTMGDYAITGTITDDDSTEYRYLPPQTLTSNISSNTRLRGYRTYIASNSVTVASGATLTLQPGTIIKFNSGCQLTVNGTLDAQGTRAAPIVFTSFKDDDHGGDTNGDGDKTYAQAGDWYQISVPGTANFNYCHVLYNSSTENTGAIDARGGTVNFNNSEIAHTRYECVNAHNSGYITARNSIFRDSSLGFGYYGSGRVKAYNCVFADIGSAAAIRQSGKLLVNCVFYKCYTAFTDQGGDGSTFQNCVFYNPPGYGPQSYSKVGSNGNIWGDPLFVDPDNGDFRIAANSPCVDAGDGSVAPEADYWGQPRMDVKRVKDTGKPNGDGVCPDIGIYEVPGAAAVPLPDLAVVSVGISSTGGSPVPGGNGNAPAARCTVGDTITLTYTVTNRGTAAATGLVRDLFRFKGADASLGGLTVDAAEIEQAYSLAAGGSPSSATELTATLTVPTLKAGTWKVEVGVNVNNYPYEQNLSNNRATTEEAISVELEAMGMGTQSVTVWRGETAGFVLSGLPMAGGVVRVTGAGVAQIAAYGGNGAVPTTSRTGGSPVQGGTAGPAVRLNGTTEPVVLPVQDGSLLIVFPARAEGENAYLVLENGGSAAATVSVEVRETELKIYGAAPGRVANVGEATVTITGSGLCGGGGRGATALPTVTLGGREAKSVEALNAAQIAATFDVEGMAAGTYDITASISGAAGPAALQNAVEIYAAKTGPKLRAWLEMPSSVRDGRVFTGYVCYANEGDSPMTMPVFKVARQDSNTKMGLVASESLTETTLYVGGISSTHPAGILKAGDEARIPFYFQPFGTYKIKLTHIKDAEDLEAYPTFGGTKAYLSAMSAAATRLNLRGRTAYNIHDFVDQALWEKNGVAHAAVSGHLIDAKTGEPLANTSISLVDAGGSQLAATDPDAQERVPPVTGTTDESGYFQLTNLADGEYRWLMDPGVTLADVSTNTLTIVGQADINGSSVYATPGGRISGYVLTATGEPIAYGTVARLNEDGSLIDAVEADGFGAFAFEGLSDGVYAIQTMPKDGYVSDTVTNIVIDAVTRTAEIVFALEKGARLGGVVTFNGVVVTNGTVQAITTDGMSYEVLCATNGVYFFDGLSAGRYAVRYYTKSAMSDDEVVMLSIGDDVTVDLVAKERPLFISTRTVGFGSCEAKFIFTDPTRAENVSAWAWDFDSDGVVDSTEASPTWNYTKLGTNTVTLVITEDGKLTTSVYKDCVRVEQPLETILADNAILFGTNSGTLQAVSMGEGTLVLSGNPVSGTLEPGMVLMGQCGEDWFCRRIVSASQSGGQWMLMTEFADWVDLYEQISFAATADAYVVDEQQPRLQGRRLLAAPDVKEGTKVYVQGGVSITVKVKPDLKTEFVCQKKDGRSYVRVAEVGSLDLGADIGLNMAVGVKFKKRIKLPIGIAIPTAVPGVVFHVDPEGVFEADAHIKGSAQFEGSVKCAIQIGLEKYDDEPFRLLKLFDVTPSPFEPKGDVEGSVSIKAGFGPKVSVKFLETVSAHLEPTAYIKAELKASAKAPAELGVSTGIEFEYGFDLLEWLDENKKTTIKKFLPKWLEVIIGFTGTVDGPSWDILKFTGPDPDFDFTPKENLEAPADVTFINQSKGSSFRILTYEQTFEPSGFEWDFGNGTCSVMEQMTNPTVTYSSKGKYKVYLRAKSKFLNGPFRKMKYVQVGEKDDDDGDEVTDDSEQDTPKKSCDPNEVNGPMGVGEARLVKPGDWMDYTIYFENKEGFDIADAQEVRVTNPLSEWLDWSTFEMREVAFNNQNDNGLFGLASGTNEVKMTGADKYVRVALGGGNYGVDAIAETGIAHWYLRVYDPNGNFGWPNDLSGFLPSNDETHRGEGHITYRIKVREDAPANVVITNSASIVFDTNDPIETDPAWWNTVGSLGVAFVESEVEVDEGGTAEIRVNGGCEEKACSVKAYLTYNTAAAADVDLKNAQAARSTSSTGGSPVQDGNAQAARSTGLKFPLTLTWEAGEIGEKVITIPIKTDKTVEDDEFFTLQLADAEGMEVGEDRVCTVTIRDLNDKTLKAAVTPYKPKKNETVATNSVGVSVATSATLPSGTVGGFVAGTGEYTSGSKLTLTAEARPGWAFVGWRLSSTGGSPVQDGDILSTKAKWQIVVTNDEEYVAVFEKIPYVRGLADPADGGKVTGSGLCAAGKKVTLKATASKNYTFVGWVRGDDSSTGGSPVLAEDGSPSSTGGSPVQDGDVNAQAARSTIATTPTLVIDRSAKSAANSKTSTTITDVDGDVTYYAVFVSDPKVTVAVEATDGKGAEATGKGAGKYVAGTITGTGKYAPGKKVTLKAAANKGYVFAGWYGGDENAQAARSTSSTGGSPVQDGNALAARSPSWSFTMPSNDVAYVAKFITAEEDKKSIGAMVDGWTLEPWVSKTETHAFATNIWAGVYLEWPIEVDALSLPTVKVAGLPAGLKFAAKPVTSKVGSGKEAVVVTNVPANTIYGAPTAASKTKTDKKTGSVTVTPSEVKVTVTTAGKSSQTYQIDTVVEALPAWAVGTFAGGVFSSTGGSPVQGGDENAQAARSTNGVVSLTVSSAGKVSGKLLEDGLTWTLSAPYFSDVECPESDVDDPVFHATVIGKSGKAEITNDVTVVVEEAAGARDARPYRRGVVNALAARSTGSTGGSPVQMECVAWQYNWKVEPWKTLGKSFDKTTMAYAILADGTVSENDEDLTSALGADVTGRVTLKFAASGSVTVSGEFAAYDEKKEKYTTVKASGSATLVPADGDHGLVFVYLTPKGLPPHACCLDVPWPEE